MACGKASPLPPGTLEATPCTPPCVYPEVKGACTHVFINAWPTS